jgi:hypothetical protein
MRNVIPTIAMLLMLGCALAIRAHHAQAAPLIEPPAAVAPTTARERFAVDVLSALGNTRPTLETVAYLEAWHRAEGGTATFNWLNTCQPATGATDYNSVGVKNYPDYQTGIQATVETLTNGYYPRTLAGLVTNRPVVDDGEMGVWGTGAGNLRARLAEH